MPNVVRSPGYCAACFQAKPDEPHVDLGAAYDGPVLAHPDGSRQSIDDLIVCAGCIRAAALALEIDEHPLEDVKLQLADARGSARAWQSYAEALETTLGRRPEPVRRGPGRPPRRPHATESA